MSNVMYFRTVISYLTSVTIVKDVPPQPEPFKPVLIGAYHRCVRIMSTEQDLCHILQ